MFCPQPFVLAEGVCNFVHLPSAFFRLFTSLRKEDIMSLLEIEGLTHTFGDNLLYKNAGFTLNKGEHVGIVGQNGTGKTTLIKICTEQVIPDEGRIWRQPKISMGYLDQYAEIDKGATMAEFLKTAFSELYHMEKEMNRLYEKAAQGDMDCLEQGAVLQEKLEISDFYSVDTRIDQVATGLGLVAIGLDRPIAEMSGGQRAKVILAKLLLEKPDILLLDEPTNFLDREHISWLSAYLSGLENSYMIISHDYDFLDKVANRICDIDNHKIAKYYGGYSEFLKKKTQQREDYVRQYTAQQREIKKTEEFIRRNIAGIKTRMAQGRRKQLERMERLEAISEKEIKPYFHFPELPVTNAEHLTVRQMAVGYYYPILRDISFSIKGGQKVVITGFNGIGKSTLLKTLVGQISAVKGDFSFSEQVTVGYYEQDLAWQDESKSPIQTVADAYPNMATKDIRRQLARCGISSKLASQPIGNLSGGEQAKVKMCLLMMERSNFLILDEPTNHLDIQAKEALKTALIKFSGTVLLVSHEEAFYRDWAEKIISLKK